jgi:hypothetical protein
MLRYAREGDMIHGKTRNKYAINHQIPRFLRNQIPVLVQEVQGQVHENQAKIIRVYNEIS